MIAWPLPAPLGYVAWGALVALFAGAVRGYAGFGLSAFIVAGTSLLLSPQQIVPAAMMLEILASLSLLPSVWRHVAWHWVGPLLAGYAVSVPLGVWCLSVLPEAPLRAVVSAVILTAALAMQAGWHPQWRDTIALRLGTGLVAGFLSGLSAVGGMVVATILFTTPLPAARLRATLVTLFFLSAWYGLAWAGVQRLVTGSTVAWAGWLLVPMLVGIAFGRRGFARAAEAQFRRAVLSVLAAVAALGLARALLGFF
ncbi:MAG: sulfite exporter TauE/SafE family protein [Casimicrobiaceae bacterium]